MNNIIESPFFHEIKANRNLQSITKNIAICGCGTIGANLAENLVRMGISKLKLVDYDRIDIHNISCQPWMLEDIGQYKAKILSNMLYRIANCKAESIIRELTVNNYKHVLNNTDLVIDCFDNSASRQILQDYTDADVLHVGFADDKYGEVIWQKSYVVPQSINTEVDPCDYPFTRSLMNILIGIATESIINYLSNSTQSSYTITLDDFRIIKL
jgi:hypothetical protein